MKKVASKEDRLKVNPDWVDAGPERNVYLLAHPATYSPLHVGPPPRCHFVPLEKRKRPVIIHKRPVTKTP